MPADLSPVLALLDERADHAPIDCFIRDDDAGWDDARQLALLDAAGAAGVPIDLAAIPQAVGGPLARELAARIDHHAALLGVHQHGCTHDNHETEGRKCEFGGARTPAAQQLDLQRGRARLQQLLGHRLDPIFTPPWNRCAPFTPELLARLGYVALSRDRTAPAQSALPELSVDLDWCKHHRTGGPAAASQAWAEALRARRDDGQPFGLMLHHAAMQPDEFALLGPWLARLARHPRLRWRAMRTLLASRLTPVSPPRFTPCSPSLD
jgi:hypothetical protein